MHESKDLISEFEFIIGDESETEYNHDSHKCVNRAIKFLENKASYQGIDKDKFKDLICIGESDTIPWNHVKLTLSVDKLRLITGERLKEFIIPSFVEEIEGTNDSIFGHNDTTINIVKYLYIPKSTIMIAPHAFSMYTKLEKVEFEEDSELLSLGDYAFACCDKLHTLDLTNCKYLDDIKENTFKNSDLKVLKINSNLLKNKNSKKALLKSLENTNNEVIVIDGVNCTKEMVVDMY